MARRVEARRLSTWMTGPGKPLPWTPAHCLVFLNGSAAVSPGAFRGPKAKTVNITIERIASAASMRIPTIATKRLTLRAFTPADAGPLYRILAEMDILRYWPTTNSPSRQQVRKLIDHQLQHWEEHRLGWWAVEPRSGDRLIGWSGLQHLPETNEVEVAYLLSRAWWGRGLATEAATACLHYGFVELGLDRIIGLTHPDNIGSQRVLEKVGLIFVDRAHYFGIEVCRYAVEHPSLDLAGHTHRISQ